MEYLKAMIRGVEENCLRGKLGSIRRESYVRAKLASLGESPYFDCGFEVVNGSSISIGDQFIAGRYCFLGASEGGVLEIGHRVAFNHHVHVNANAGGTVRIADCVLLGPNVVLRASDHCFDKPNVPIRDQGHESGVIEIAEDVWIGANTVVCKDVVIGRGAVVGAGAVVTKSVEPFTVVAGVPARPIGKRG
ncbi:MAG: acyltransferase [Verrucomicrobiota bacterium]